MLQKLIVLKHLYVQIRIPIRIISQRKREIVELEGIEPSSKRGMNMLSTCLALLTIFVVLLRERQPKRYPYSMI